MSALPPPLLTASPCFTPVCVGEQNAGHHVKFLQTTEYELFDLSGLFFFFPLQIRQPGGREQPGKHLPLSWPPFDTLCIAEAPGHTPFHNNKRLQNGWTGEKATQPGGPASHCRGHFSQPIAPIPRGPSPRSGGAQGLRRGAARGSAPPPAPSRRTRSQ